MAEGMFLHLVEKAGLNGQIQVDSCGTGAWHTGERADRRMRQTAQGHGIELLSRARQIRETDFQEFDYILAMDQSNLQDLKRFGADVSNRKAELFKMRHFDPMDRNADVPDPYWGGERGFEEVYQMLERTCAELLAHIRQEKQI